MSENNRKLHNQLHEHIKALEANSSKTPEQARILTSMRKVLSGLIRSGSKAAKKPDLKKKKTQKKR